MLKFIPKHNKGMTLVEVLMALLIFSLVVIVLFDFMGEGVRNIKVADGQADNLQDSRLILQNFEKDVRESLEVISYIDTNQHTVIQIRKKTGLVDDARDLFVVWTYYKTEITLDSKKYALALCRDTFEEVQPADTLATTVKIKGINMARSGNRVGLAKEAQDQFGNKIKTYLYAYNIYYDPGFQDKEFLSVKDKENMAARARFTNVDGISGFNNLEEIVAFEINFLTNDDRNNLHIFHSIIYVRSLFYQQIYDM